MHLFYASSGQGTAALLQLENGTPQRAYKCAPCRSPRAVCDVCPGPGQPSHLIISQEQHAIFAFGGDSTQPKRKSIVAERITALQASPCGGTVIVGGGESGVVYVWSGSTGDLLSLVKGQLRETTCVAFDGTGAFVAVASEDTTCRVYETATIAAVGTASARPTCVLTAHTLPVMAVSFFHTKCWVATASSDQSCRLFDVPSGRCMWVSRTECALRSVCVLASDHHVILGGESGSLWEMQLYREGPPVVKRCGQGEDGHRSAVTFVAGTDGPESFISGSQDGLVLAWSAGQVVREVMRLKPTLNYGSLSFALVRGEFTTSTSAPPLLRKYPLGDLAAYAPSLEAPARKDRAAPISKRERARRKRDQQRHPEHHPVDDVFEAEEEVITPLEQRKRTLREKNARLLVLANQLYAAKAATPE